MALESQNLLNVHHEGEGAVRPYPSAGEYHPSKLKEARRPCRPRGGNLAISAGSERQEHSKPIPSRENEIRHILHRRIAMDHSTQKPRGPQYWVSQVRHEA